jgi:hypothetical protein
MKNAEPNIGTRSAQGEPLCQLHLRAIGEIAGGLWSWRVYVDGNVHGRGPGSSRKDPLPWHASLPAGPHRLVLRKGQGADALESNTLHFEVVGAETLLVDVRPLGDGVLLAFAPGDDDAAT